MTPNRNSRILLSSLTAAMLLVAPACSRSEGGKEVKDKAQMAAELEKLDNQAHAAGSEEARKLAEAGVNNVAPNPATLQLSSEQRTFLEARIKAEKDSSYKAMLQEVLDKDKEIATLNQRIAQLRSALPSPEVAKAGDSHYGMAMGFLRRKGVPEEKAKELVSRVLIMDSLSPGFAVYHFYSHGVYGTWVAQGKAALSPTQLQANQRTKIEGERDEAELKAQSLQADVSDLTAQKGKLAADIEALGTEKAKMLDDLKTLTAANQAQQALLNSVHYAVGARKSLEKRGVIVVPTFAKDRAGANWSDSVFTQSADLRSEDSVTLTAAEAGLDRIGKIDVVPGSLVKDKHYSVEYNDDRTSATVKFLVKDRFRNEKVVFALAD